ncbi:hypothetical protein F9K79_09530 [Ochrobactrum sp. Kaboul]|nr:hypothetical protein F9K79_09530 [Ochrobactrum sp. Kaboul]
MSDLSSYLSTRNKQWSAKLWDGFIEAVQARLAPLEEQLDIQKEVADAIVARGLTVIEQELAPIVAQAAVILDENLAEVTAKLARLETKVTGGTVLTTSSTPASLSNGGTINLTIAFADREFFATTPYVALSRASTTATWGVGKVNSFNRSTGALELTLEQVTGAGGPYADWIITSLPGATLLQKIYYEQTLALRQQVAEDKVTTASDRSTALTARQGAETAAGVSVAARDASQQAYADMRKAISVPLVPPSDPQPGQLWWDGHLVRVYDGTTFVPSATASIGGVRTARGTFGENPDGVIIVAGGFSFALVFVNGALLSTDNYLAESPYITITAPASGDEYLVWAYQENDAADYDTRDEVTAKISAALTGKAVRVDEAQTFTVAERNRARTNIRAASLGSDGKVPISEIPDGLFVSTLTKSSWAELSAIAGEHDGQRGYVEADSGTHIDPVTGTNVPNNGIYAWVTASSVWQWLRLDDLGDLQTRVGNLEETVNGVPTTIEALSGGTLISDPSTSQFVMLDAAGVEINRFSWTDLLTSLQEQLDMSTNGKTYSFDLSATFGTTPIAAVNVPDEGYRITEVYGQVSPTAPGRFVLAFGGRTPVLNASGSLTMKPGQVFEVSNPPSGEVMALAEAEGTEVTIVAVSTQNQNPNIASLISAHLARYTASLTSKQRTALSMLYLALYNAGAINGASGGILGVFAGYNNTDALLNWNGSGDVGALDGAPNLSWLDYTFDGVDDAINTGRPLASMVDRTDHTIMIYTSGTTYVGANKYAIGDSTTRINPLRSASAIATQSLTSGGTVTTLSGSNGLVGITRNSEAEYTAFRNSEAQIISTPTITSSSYPIRIGAVTGASGIVGNFPGPILFAYIGKALTMTQTEAIRAALVAYEAAAAEF